MHVVVSNLTSVRPLTVTVGLGWSCDGQEMIVRCDEEWLNCAVCVVRQAKTWWLNTRYCRAFVVNSRPAEIVEIEGKVEVEHDASIRVSAFG